MKKHFLLGLIALCLFACSNDDQQAGVESNKQQAEFLVINEGQYTKGTSSLTAVYRDGTVKNDAFKGANNRSLGDVAQSIAYMNGLYFIVVNNSSKIEVVKPDTYQSVATIELESGSPRYITPLSDSKALVSDMNNELAVIDTKTYKVLNYIELDNYKMEQMVTVGNKVFAVVGQMLKVIDTNNITAEGIRSIDLGDISTYTTAQPIVDSNNKIWILASEWLSGNLICIDPTTEKVIDTFKFPYYTPKDKEYTNGCITGLTSFPRIDTDKSKSKLYFNVRTLKDKNSSNPYVYCFDITTKTFKPYVELTGLGLLYGMGVSATGEVYVCDALDYSAQRGYIRHYKTDGTVQSYQAGIFPNTVFFTDKISE